MDLDSAGTQGPITNTNGDFGYYIVPASLGNFVWEDDGDGVQQAGEPGIGGVEVTLDITYPNGDCDYGKYINQRRHPGCGW